LLAILPSRNFESFDKSSLIKYFCAAFFFFLTVAYLFFILVRHCLCLLIKYFMYEEHKIKMCTETVRIALWFHAFWRMKYLSCPQNSLSLKCYVMSKVILSRNNLSDFREQFNIYLSIYGYDNYLYYSKYLVLYEYRIIILVQNPFRSPLVYTY